MHSAVRSIPFFNYPALFSAQEDELMEIMRDVCRRGAFILQQDLADFERNLAKRIGAKFAFGVANGTDALNIALRASGVKPGDGVIVPSHTYVASAAAIHFAGANPVLVECGADHMMDPACAEAAVTPSTRAIMPVHLNGRTCDMDAIGAIAERHNLIIVEDAAQAVGSIFKGRHAGTFGAAGTYSFYPAKILGSFGDGGAIVTNDDAVAEQVSLLRDHGRNEDGDVVAWGLNSRLDNLQAAILNFKLGHLTKDLERRREIASQYDEALRDIGDLTLPPRPMTGDDHYDVFQNYEIECGRRNELREFLEDQGVGTIIQWGGKAVHQFSGLGFKVELPNTDNLFSRCMMLPMHTALSNEDVQYICSAIRNFYGLSS